VKIQQLEKLSLTSHWQQEEQTSLTTALLRALPRLKLAQIRSINSSGCHVLPPECGQLKLEHLHLPPRLRPEEVANLPHVKHVQFGENTEFSVKLSTFKYENFFAPLPCFFFKQNSFSRALGRSLKIQDQFTSF